MEDCGSQGRATFDPQCSKFLRVVADVLTLLKSGFGFRRVSGGCS
jgi:hypothetical protein